MIRVPPHLETLVFGLGPVLLIALLALVWAHLTRVLRLRRVLQLSALIWPLVLATTLGLAALAGATCAGNALYGYGRCTLVSDQFSNLTTTILVLSYLAALAYTAVLLIYAVLKEIRAVPQS